MSKSIETVRNDNLRVLDPMCRTGRNFCKYSRNNSDAHENLKWRVFMSLRKQGCDVVTEAIFLNKSRADLYILDLNVAVEILETENLVTCIKKIKKYPSEKVWLVKDGLVFFSLVYGDVVHPKKFEEVFP